jgi:alkyl hydroperoxide reductase subunit D
MSIDHLKDRLPEHAKDLRFNLGALTSSMTLKPQQAWGTALAAAVASRNPEVVAAIAADAPLSPEAAAAARGAAAIMGMNNIYYRFRYTMGNGSAYADFPARLRTQIIGQPGVDSVDFELWCLAASVITGSENCVRSHENTVREQGGTTEQVQDAVRIAAVVHAVALTLDSAPRCRLGHPGAAAEHTSAANGVAQVTGAAAEHTSAANGVAQVIAAAARGSSSTSASNVASAIATAAEFKHRGPGRRSSSLKRPSGAPGRR